jgi:hypothetical protein
MGRSSTLVIGDRAPEFRLAAANSAQAGAAHSWATDGTIALDDLLTRGPAVVEFLRGTW